MEITIPLETTTEYGSVAILLLLYWNASIVISRSLWALVTVIFMMRLNYICTILYSLVHETALLMVGVQSTMAPFDVTEWIDSSSQLVLAVDTVSLAMLVGSSIQAWAGAMTSRITLVSLQYCMKRKLRWWEVLSSPERCLILAESLLGVVCCVLQWAYYTLLSDEERTAGSGENISIVMWYTSLVYITTTGLHYLTITVTVFMRLCGYAALTAVTNKLSHSAARALEGSALNPFSEEHQLYLKYINAIGCLIVSYYYAPPSLPAPVQLYVMMQLFLMGRASANLKSYRQLLNGFPSVLADGHGSCGICLDDFHNGETVKRLPCGHIFHGHCVRPWLMQSHICPFCRQPAVPQDMLEGRDADDTLRPTRLQQQHRHRLPRRPRRPTAAGAPVVGGGAFTGSLHPLIPQLQPSTATHPPPSELRRRQLSSIQLPYLTELQQVDAALQRMEDRRLHRNGSPTWSHPRGAVPASEDVQNHPQLNEEEMSQPQSSRDDLFSEEPLVSSTHPRRRRYRSGERHNTRGEDTTISATTGSLEESSSTLVGSHRGKRRRTE